MSRHLTPMEVCERLIGGPEVMARLADLHAKSGFTWRKESKWRDAGDLPPRVNRVLLVHSDAYKLGLTAEHLIRGATEKEVEAILAARPQAQEPVLPAAEPDAA